MNKLIITDLILGIQNTLKSSLAPVVDIFFGTESLSSSLSSLSFNEVNR